MDEREVEKEIEDLKGRVERVEGKQDDLRQRLLSAVGVLWNAKNVKSIDDLMRRIRNALRHIRGVGSGDSDDDN